jgi:hypothetical protein
MSPPLVKVVWFGYIAHNPAGGGGIFPFDTTPDIEWGETGGGVGYPPWVETTVLIHLT